MTDQTPVTYTVLHDSAVLGRHLTAAEAAAEILTHDGREYDIRPEQDGGFTLWSRQEVANRGWTRTVIYSAADTMAEAEAEIFGRVIAAGWDRHPDAMTDADYDAMMADLAEED